MLVIPDWVEWESGGLRFDVFANGRRRGNRQAALEQALEMEVDGFTNQGFHFFQRLCHGHASRQVGNCRSVAGRSFQS